MGQRNAYKIFKDWQVIVIYYSGDVTIDDVKTLMAELSKEPDYSPKFATINDFRDSNLLIKITEIRAYINYLRDKLKIIEKRKIAFLTTKPHHVVTTQLFNKYASVFSVMGQVFTTTEGLLEWLQNDSLDCESFHNIISEIKSRLKILDTASGI